MSQQEEIATIKERNISLKLSDADCERLLKKCGEHGLTVGELIENFIGDLVEGTYSNGSDERDLANQWFERCWFGMFPERTLLNHLLSWGYDPEDYLNLLENIKDTKNILEYTLQHSELPYYENDIKACGEDIAGYEEELNAMRADWKTEKEPNMDEELELIRQYVRERENFLNEQGEVLNKEHGVYRKTKIR